MIGYQQEDRPASSIPSGAGLCVCWAGTVFCLCEAPVRKRRPAHAFWLQTATDRFYPDFVALLKDGRYLVVEFKGEHLWSNADSMEKRDVGGL